MNPNLVGPYNFLFLLPYASALLVLHLGAARWVAGVTIALNAIVAVFGLLLGVMSILGGAAYPVLAAIFSFTVLLVPAACNVRALVPYVRRRNVVPTS
jgi:hypothetical protein